MVVPHRSGKCMTDLFLISSSIFFFFFFQSAVNHDAILNATGDEKMRLEEEASRVAKRASEALRQSQMVRSRESISVPTWTGRSGAAGAPSSVPRRFGSAVSSQLITRSKPSEESCSSGMNKTDGVAAGASAGKALSSAELLARIRGNQERATDDGLEHQLGLGSANRARSTDSGPSSSSSRSSHNLSSLQPEVLIRKICTFIQQKGGSANSATIVQHFKDRIPSKDLPLFKNLLKEIATLEKDPNGSSWVLKPEYR